MKTEKALPEPSMDEILASIRQIISGEQKGEAAISLENEDILDLTDILPEETGRASSLKKFQEKHVSPEKNIHVKPIESGLTRRENDKTGQEDFFHLLKETSKNPPAESPP